MRQSAVAEGGRGLADAEAAPASLDYFCQSRGNRQAKARLVLLCEFYIPLSFLWPPMAGSVIWALFAWKA